MIGATVLLSSPSWSNAVDLASISGGAASVSSATNSLFASLSETGFYQAFSLVFVSEIGDKTFFIAGLLAMKTSKLISFAGSMGALFVMTLISVLIGQVFHVVPSGFLGEGAAGIPLDDVAAVLAFAFFGYKTLKEALEMEDGTSTMDEELAEAEEEVEASDTTKQSTVAYVPC
jgi:putative Ca2+/H+ antiporter (TMEM165/GDT1 family)